MTCTGTGNTEEDHRFADINITIHGCIAEGTAGAQNKICPVQHDVIVIVDSVFHNDPEAFLTDIIRIQVQNPKREISGKCLKERWLIADQGNPFACVLF